MQIIYAHDRFICLCTYQQKDIPKSTGFRWEPKEKYWYTEQADVAGKLIKFCDPEATRIVSASMEQASKNIEASKAKDSDINLPCPEGLAYLPFQSAGIAYCCTQLRINTEKAKGILPTPSSGVLIADDMGLG
jgi:SWI/SNF-related matrix-associated actin-dependent regulator 1 of chromatin subfamily A